MTTTPAAVPDSAAPREAATAFPPKSTRYQMLDFWRGASCLALVVFHATMQLVHQGISFEGTGWERAGAAITAVAARTWIGVPIFFVISGYCIMATIDSRRRKSTSIPDYIHRRVRRIYPPYLIALASASRSSICESLAPMMLTRMGVPSALPIQPRLVLTTRSRCRPSRSITASPGQEALSTWTVLCGSTPSSPGPTTM